jgi:hypothetical protein
VNRFRRTLPLSTRFGWAATQAGLVLWLRSDVVMTAVEKDLRKSNSYGHTDFSYWPE